MKFAGGEDVDRPKEARSLGALPWVNTALDAGQRQNAHVCIAYGVKHKKIIIKVTNSVATSVRLQSVSNLYFLRPIL